MGAIANLAGIRDIEVSLVTALEEALAGDGVRVVAEPNPGRASMPLADRECLVGWIGDSVGSPQPLARGRCAIERRFRVHLRCKALRDHREGYDLVDKVLNAVHFVSVPDAEPSFPASVTLVGYDEASAFYAYDVECVYKTYVGGKKL